MNHSFLSASTKQYSCFFFLFYSFGPSSFAFQRRLIIDMRPSTAVACSRVFGYVFQYLELRKTRDKLGDGGQRKEREREFFLERKEREREFELSPPFSLHS